MKRLSSPTAPATRLLNERTIRAATPTDWAYLRAVQAASLSSCWPALLRIALETEGWFGRVDSGRRRSSDVAPGAATNRALTTNDAPTTCGGPFALVAVVDDAPVGYALALGDERPIGLTDASTPDVDASADDRPSAASAGDGSDADEGGALTLVELAVAPGHRGDGHGSALLEAVVAVAGSSDVRLTVRADDRRARRFYADHGFRVKERLPEYYDGRAGLVLTNGA